MLRRGFSLTELMFSILILGLGLIAVAGLFPVAGTMQKATYDDMVALQFADTARSAIETRGFSQVDLAVGTGFNPANPGDPSAVSGLPNYVLDPGGPLGLVPEVLSVPWHLVDRCYPSPLGPPNNPNLNGVSFIWVPLIKRKPFNAAYPLGEYEIYVFILRVSENYRAPSGGANSGDPAGFPRVVSTSAQPQANSNVFQVTNAKTLFDTGDAILDSVGHIYTVIEVQADTVRVDRVVDTAANAIWHGHRGGLSNSPTKKIMVFSNSVVVPASGLPSLPPLP